MKRKRGYKKKGKGKKPKSIEATLTSTSPVVEQEEENNNTAVDVSDNEEEDNDDSGMDAEPEISPSPVVEKPIEVEKPVQVEKPVVDIAPRPIDNTFGRAVYTRVKVRLKNSKNLESQNNLNPNPVVDKVEQQVRTETKEEKKDDVAVVVGSSVSNEKIEDSGGGGNNSLSEINGVVKKLVGIKIKSSKGFGVTSSMSPCSNVETVKVDNAEKKDVTPVQQESRYSEQELKLALEVVRKVMKMDAAVPFNVPVDPVALGIPDYFDVIDTPMDFGTVCKNLEKGAKYKNSEDVFKDVEYIWNNCYKYNNKGDYVVELMKRVKKNFMKYWMAVGLFNDQSQEAIDAESNPVKDGNGTPSSQERDNAPPVNSVPLVLSGKKFHGLKKHKEGCQCAICVMMRRRQEKAEIERLMGGADGSDNSMGEDNNPEGTSRGESPFGEYDSSNVENSPETVADMQRKGQESKFGHIRSFYGQQKENGSSGVGNREGSQDLHSKDENDTNYLAALMGSGSSILNDNQKEMHVQNYGGADQQKPKEVLDKNQRAKMLENLRYLDNPMVVELCGTLFPDNSKSFWNGPHSLAGHKSTSRRSSMHSAISSFMK